MGLSGNVALRYLVDWRFDRGGCRVVESLRTPAHDASANETFQRAQRAVLFRRHKTNGVADCLRPAGPADAVDVVLGMLWEIIIDDV